MDEFQQVLAPPRSGKTILLQQIANAIAQGAAAVVGEKEMGPLAEAWRPWRGAAAYMLWSYYRTTKQREGAPIPAFIIRKEPKKHGTAQWIEGVKNLRPGMKVAIVEDVVTTGASTIKAIDRAIESGLEVSRVLALVDRNEGGAQTLAEKGYKLEPLFLKEDVENA